MIKAGPSKAGQPSIVRERRWRNAKQNEEASDESSAQNQGGKVGAEETHGESLQQVKK